MRFTRVPSREQSLKDDPLRDHHVWWLDVTKRDAEKLQSQLDSASSERDMQQYIEQHPTVLIHHLCGGHGRYVIPQKRLGAEYVTDFIIGHAHSGGFEWQAVEIESPKKKMFTKGGNPTKELTQAIRQIQDWRAWLSRNQNYAARPIAESGLGLTDIVASIPGLIIIGRRSNYDELNNDRRRQMANDLNIQFHSFDFLVDHCFGYAEAYEKLRRTWKAN